MARRAKVEPPPVQGLLLISGWHGTTAYPVAVIGMTPHRFRIRALQRTRLAGRGRYLESGETTLVPKTAVRITGPVLPRETTTREPGE